MTADSGNQSGETIIEGNASNLDKDPKTLKLRGFSGDSGGSSDEEQLNALLSKKEILPSYYMMSHKQIALSRMGGRKRVSQKVDMSAFSTTPNPPYKSYLISDSLDHRLQTTFALQSEVDMQNARKEDYCIILDFLQSCGAAMEEGQVSCLHETVDMYSISKGLKKSQQLLHDVFEDIALCSLEPFSEISGAKVIQLWQSLNDISTFSPSLRGVPISGLDHKASELEPLVPVLGENLPPALLQLIREKSSRHEVLLECIKAVSSMMACCHGNSFPYSTILMETATQVLKSVLESTQENLPHQLISQFVSQMLRCYNKEDLNGESGVQLVASIVANHLDSLKLVLHFVVDM